jgi:hypothetical protein
LASLGNEDSEITLVVRVGNVGVLPPAIQMFPIQIIISAQNRKRKKKTQKVIKGGE